MHEGYRIKLFETAGWHALIWRPEATHCLMIIPRATVEEGPETCALRAMEAVDDDKAKLASDE
jgi:hypothetical protein